MPAVVPKDPVIANDYWRGYEDGYKIGYENGSKEGQRRGRRRGKGKPEYAKPHGGQKPLHDVWALQFFDFVEESIADGKISLSAAAGDYLRKWTQYLKRERLSDNPDLAQKIFTLEPTKARAALVRLYTRMKKGTDKIDPNIRKQYAAIRRLPSEI